jgi:hypothetical protein
MPYFIFQKNKDNIENTVYKIAENDSDLSKLNINNSDYKIIEVTQANFNDVKFGIKHPVKYNNNDISFINFTHKFNNKLSLELEIKMQSNNIKNFIENNLNHSLYARWDNYLNQLNNLNLDLISYPINKSLEQYFNDLGQPSFNILQLP